MGLPAPLPALVWVGCLLGRAAWAALAVLLLVPGSAAGGAGSDSAAWFAGALFVLVVGLAAWGARRLPPRPDQVLGIVWTLALPLALGALLLVVISR
jgi:NADH:ubiquinone oxidoreductase subunit H